MSKKKKTPSETDVFMTTDGEWTSYFRVPLTFQIHQNSMTQSEKDVFIFFMIQVNFKKTLKIPASNEDIRYWTGIKNEVTARNAIRGLAEKGWLYDIIYQKRGSNVYVLNLEPVKNMDLINKMDMRSHNTSKAKKKSIKKGEAGKFETILPELAL